MLKYSQINNVVSLNHTVVLRINSVVLRIRADDLRMDEEIFTFRH